MSSHADLEILSECFGNELRIFNRFSSTKAKVLRRCRAARLVEVSRDLSTVTLTAAGCLALPACPRWEVFEAGTATFFVFTSDPAGMMEAWTESS